MKTGRDLQTRLLREPARLWGGGAAVTAALTAFVYLEFVRMRDYPPPTGRVVFVGTFVALLGAGCLAAALAASSDRRATALSAAVPGLTVVGIGTIETVGHLALLAAVLAAISFRLDAGEGASISPSRLGAPQAWAAVSATVVGIAGFLLT